MQIQLDREQLSKDIKWNDPDYKFADCKDWLHAQISTHTVFSSAAICKEMITHNWMPDPNKDISDPTKYKFTFQNKDENTKFLMEGYARWFVERSRLRLAKQIENQQNFNQQISQIKATPLVYYPPHTNNTPPSPLTPPISNTPPKPNNKRPLSEILSTDPITNTPNPAPPAKKPKLTKGPRFNAGLTDEQVKSFPYTTVHTRHETSIYFYVEIMTFHGPIFAISISIISLKFRLVK